MREVTIGVMSKNQENGILLMTIKCRISVMKISKKKSIKMGVEMLIFCSIRPFMDEKSLYDDVFFSILLSLSGSIVKSRVKGSRKDSRLDVYGTVSSSFH